MDIPDVEVWSPVWRVSTSHLITELYLHSEIVPRHWCEKRIKLVSNACALFSHLCRVFFLLSHFVLHSLVQMQSDKPVFAFRIKKYDVVEIGVR
jgi:hypothetical protein